MKNHIYHRIQRKIRLSILAILIALTIASCTSISISERGTVPYFEEHSVPKFIVIGKTTKSEIYARVGVPLTHRKVLTREVFIYSEAKLTEVFLNGHALARELVIRFENDIVVDASYQKTGQGEGTLSNPGLLNSPNIDLPSNR